MRFSDIRNGLGSIESLYTSVISMTDASSALAEIIVIGADCY